jgi:phosphatidate cytidylyltransferase
MSSLRDPVVQRLLGGLLAALVLGTVAGRLLALRARTEVGRATVANMNARITAWWVMSVFFSIALLCIPVSVFLLIPAVLAVIGKTHDFLRRTATLQWG